tara:strand:+ start:708 stop:902 length:195 start_codon:yes stop_codon:yes gene_type:complete
LLCAGAVISSSGGVQRAGINVTVAWERSVSADMALTGMPEARSLCVLLFEFVSALALQTVDHML